MTRWQDDVLTFWFGLTPEQHWKPDPALDARIRDRFEQLWLEERRLPASEFLANERDALAGILLFDQIPRNMYRGHADQFSTDPLALAIAKGAVERGHDDALTGPERGFLYMPFQHSEAMEDQLRSLALFTALGDAYQLGFARKHHEIVARFGRFPHRNLMLGRKPRADEIAAGEMVPW